MKIVVFGGAGRTGRRVVEQALQRGHDVAAFVHSTTNEEMMARHPRLRIVVGDVLDQEEVTEAIRGTEVVISVLGHGRGTIKDMQTRGMRHIVSAMKKFGLKRIVILTGTGVRFPDDHPSMIDRVANAFIKLVDRNRIADGIGHVEVLKSSGLSWTVLRVLKLTNDKPRGAYQLEDAVRKPARVARANAATALLDLVESSDYVQQAPVIVPKLT